MRILAIDTSCGAASVAVVEGGLIEPLAVLSRPMTRGHAEAIAPMVEEAMRGIEGGFASLGRIAVAAGPGSFTGIRVGLAMARAMGVALAIPVVGVSTLAALAAPLLSEPKAGIIAAAIDARHGSVYFQLFEASGRPLGPPRCDTARECVRAIGAGPAWLAGDAAAILANAAHRAGLPYDLDAARDAPDIVALARMGLALDPSVSPARPIYVKPPDARAESGRIHRSRARLTAAGLSHEIRSPQTLPACHPAASAGEGGGLRPPARRGLRASVVDRGGRGADRQFVDACRRGSRSGGRASQGVHICRGWRRTRRRSSPSPSKPPPRARAWGERS